MFTSIKYIKSARFYIFYRCKLIVIPTCTQLLWTRAVRRPDDDSLTGRNM